METKAIVTKSATTAIPTAVTTLAHRGKDAAPFYYCEMCKQRHPATLDKMSSHMQELRAKGYRPILVKQGRANIMTEKGV